MKLHKNYQCLGICKNCKHRKDYDYSLPDSLNYNNNYYFCSNRCINFDKKSFGVKIYADVTDMTKDYCAAKKQTILKEYENYMITTLGDYFVIRKLYKWGYESHILSSNDINTLEEHVLELLKKKKKKPRIIQETLF